MLLLGLGLVKDDNNGIHRGYNNDVLEADGGTYHVGRGKGVLILQQQKKGGVPTTPSSLGGVQVEDEFMAKKLLSCDNV